MVFGGGWRIGGGGGRWPRRGFGYGPFGRYRRGPYEGYGYGSPYGYRRGGGGGGCASSGCLLGSGCCIGESLDGNCLVLTLGLLPRLFLVLVHGTAAGDSGHRLRLNARLIGAVRLYQQQISPHLPNSCRFEPSCSQYAVEALTVHGSRRGGWLALRRLVRCRPGAARGADPVPLGTVQRRRK
jgi:putative membrane protein insertion efficiency factor